MFAQLPAGPFDLILADPPWTFASYSDKGQGKSPSQHYDVLTVEQICSLPVASIAAPNAGLCLWVYVPQLLAGLAVMQAWGFTYQSDLLTWVKLLKHGKVHISTGLSGTRKSHEKMLFGTKGEFFPVQMPDDYDIDESDPGWMLYGSRGKDALKVQNRSIRSVLFAAVRGHSVKPDEQYELLEKLYGPMRRLELFARQRRPGWTSWGSEVPAEAA